MVTVILAFGVCALSLCASNVFCFYLGMRVAQSKATGEKIIQIPKIVTPKVKEQREKENYEVILENIENYDGTPEGQKDLPWR